jgi:hypothetical protein
MRREVILRTLNDYSGEFLPGLQLGDFSHDTLVHLVALYSQLYIAMDGFWYLAVMERHGNDEALACDMRAWERVAKYEMKRITEALNIKGNDVVAFMKALQLTPWCQKTKYEMDIEGLNRATFTVTYCPTLAALEREGKGRQVPICTEIEPKIMEWYAHFFNPEMKFEPLTPLPRQSRDDVCCKWTVYIKD